MLGRPKFFKNAAIRKMLVRAANDVVLMPGFWSNVPLNISLDEYKDNDYHMIGFSYDSELAITKPLMYISDSVLGDNVSIVLFNPTKIKTEFKANDVIGYVYLLREANEEKK